MNVEGSTTTQWQIDASRWAMLRRLADDLAHEIKNPLNSMVINLEVLRSRIEKGAQQAALERAAVLEHEIRRLHALIDGLLRLVRPPREQEQTTSLALVLDELLPLIQLRARLERVGFQANNPSADAFIAVPPDFLRFGLLMISDQVLDCARHASDDMWLGIEQQEDEVHLRVGLVRSTTTQREDQPVLAGALHGVPAARALLEPVGCRIEQETGSLKGAGSAILVRIPRVLFLRF